MHFLRYILLVDIDETVIMPFSHEWLSAGNDKIISTKFMLKMYC